MPEISPRITYSPEGVLELRKAVDEDIVELEAAYARQKEKVDALPGYEVTEEGSETIVSVEVEKVIRPKKEPSFNNPATEQLIKNLGLFTYFDYQDPRDGVFSIEFWSDRGANGAVFPHFQRWLNAGGLDESVSRRCIDAMAYPMGLEARRQAKKDFRYEAAGESAAAGVGGFTFGVISRKEDFRIATQAGMGEASVYRSGTVGWNWITLSTIGNCACWGPSGEEREHVYISPDRMRLYEMGPHNVDSATQSLSLVLGAAALAYEAAQYSGTEDILADAIWHKRKI